MSGTVVVGGVGPNIGAHTARRFAERGYDVGLFARSGGYLRDLAADVRASNPDADAVGVEVDLTEQTDVEAGFQRVHDTLGPTDVYVHNPDYVPERARTVTAVDPDDFRANWAVKARSLYLATRNVLPVMRERGGTVIVTGSAYGRRARGKYPAYESAAMATRGFARSLAKAHGDEGVDVSYVVVDGAVDTDDPDAIDPGAVARQFVDIAEQDGSVRVHEEELRGPDDAFYV